MLHWVWFLGFSWRGKVGSKKGLLGKQKLEAVQRQRWKRGQDGVYMTLCNSLCQLVVFTACHFLDPQSPAVQRWAKTVSQGVGESSWRSLKTPMSCCLFTVHFFTNLVFIFWLRRTCASKWGHCREHNLCLYNDSKCFATRLAGKQQWVVGTGKGSFLSINLKTQSRRCCSELTLDCSKNFNNLSWMHKKNREIYPLLGTCWPHQYFNKIFFLKNTQFFPPTSKEMSFWYRRFKDPMNWPVDHPGKHFRNVYSHIFPTIK